MDKYTLIDQRQGATGACEGCVALPGIKQAVFGGGDIEQTLCRKLGPECLEKGKIWVKK